MILSKLLQFELKYHSKQKSFIVFLILFILYGILTIPSKFQFLENSTMYNDAYNLSLLSGIISIGTLFPCIYLCINGLLRDENYKFSEILYSTGVSKNNLFVSRFLIIFIIILFFSSLSIFGVFIGTYFADSNPETHHIFNFSHYFLPWLLLILPNAFIVSSLLFSATLLSEKATITYITGVIIIGFYWVSAFSMNSPLIGGSSLSSPEITAITSLTDIFGLASFFEQTQFLTPVEKNEYSISFSRHFLWNRILWIIIGIVTLFTTYKLFSFRKLNNRLKKSILKKENVSNLRFFESVKTSPDTIRMKFIAFWSLIKIDFKSTLKSIPFLVLIFIWIVILCFSFNYATNGVEVYGSRYPTTDLLLGLIIEILPVFGLLLIVFFSGDLIWKSRSYNFSEIIDATPVQNSVFFTSKLLVLLLIPTILIVIAILTGIIFQIINGYYDFNIYLYFSTFYYGGLQLLLYTIFCLFVQTMVANKYFGMVISGVIIFFFSTLSKNIGLEHPLLLFNNLPSMSRSYSNFTGYGHYISKFNWIAFYWTIFSGILIVFGYKFWKRGLTTQLKLKVKWSFQEKIVLGFLLLLFSSIGSFVFYKTNILNEYKTKTEAYNFNEDYERKYKKYDALPVPKLVAVNTKMDIFPNENRYSAVVENVIENSSLKPITEIFITAKSSLSSLNIENANQVFYDSVLQTYLFRLKKPILKNEQLKMSYQVDKKSTSFNIDNSIAKNGSYIKSSHFIPFLGYVNRYEINDSYEREKRKLSIKKDIIITDNHLSNNTKFNFENINFETIISTDSKQKAFSSGDLIKQWNSKKRSYYHYKSKGKIDNLIAYFSGLYKVEKILHKGINIEFYYLPEHYRNVAEMIKVAKATIDYCTDNFGAYPHKYLRIGEVSTFAGANGQAMPGVISINEKIFKKSMENPESFNIIARVLVHEISHQWWGLLLTPKKIEGATFISESLAKYSETVILEKLYGKKMVNRLSEYTLRKYFSGRSRTNKIEPPLYLTAQEPYLAYSKGAIVLNAIKDLIGEKKLNSALKNLIIKYKKEATVTSLNLLEEIHLVSSKESHILINDWLKCVITYDLSIKTATYKKLKNNRYEIKIIVSSQRYKTNQSGKEDKIAINEPIKIGVFKNNQKKNINSEVLYLKFHLIDKQKNEFTIVVDEIPKYISIDPYFTRLDRNISNNTKMINKI